MSSIRAHGSRSRLRVGLLPGILSAVAVLMLGCAAAPPRAPAPMVPAATQAPLELHGAAAGIPITRTFKVIDRDGAAVAGAGIYVDGVCAGVTDAEGALAYAAREGAAVVALRQVGEQPAVRRDPAAVALPAAARADCTGGMASCAGFGCAYRAFQTSLAWRPPAATAPPGAVEPYAAILPAAGTAITLTLAPTRPLILFNLLVSIEWDAQPDYLADLAEGLRQASQYIWDYTDGQMALDEAAILTNGVGWSAADIQVRASNEICPQASIGGMTRPPTSARSAITLGPYWTEHNGADPAGRWSLPAGYRTIGHEFAHYALGLYDQYVDARRAAGAWCTTQVPQLSAADSNASIMDRQYATSELDDEQFNWAPDCEKTWHYAVFGASAWATIGQKSWAGATATTPSRQGGRNPGPHTWPSALPPWPLISYDARPAEAVPINLRVEGAGAYNVYVMQCHRGNTGSLRLGRMVGGEAFPLLGVRPGDLIWVEDRQSNERRGAVRAPTDAGELTIRLCERSRPVSCHDPLADGLCEPAVSPAPAPTAIAGGAEGEQRSLLQHGYKRDPERDAFPNTLESADGRLRLHVDAFPPGDIVIVQQAVSEEIRRFLLAQEVVPVSNLYHIAAEHQTGFSIDAQVQSICPPAAPAPPGLWRATPAAGSDEKPRLTRVEPAFWFPQEGYLLAPLSAPGTYLLAARP